MSGFSLHQTEPIQGKNNGSWSGEGQQYLHQHPISSQGNVQGLSDFNAFPVQDTRTVQNRGRSSLGSTRSQWNAELSATQMESAEMSRFPSQDSIGKQSRRTTNSYDHNQSTRMYPSVSQMSYQMSSARSDVTGRSNSPEIAALYTPSQQIELHAFDSFPYTEDLPGEHSIYHGDSASGVVTHPINVSLTTASSYSLYATAGDEAFVPVPGGPNTLTSQGSVSLMYTPGTILDVSAWDNGTDYLDSRRSSPILGEDSWPLPSAPIMVSPMNSPLNYSPGPEGLSPSFVEEYTDMVELPYTSTGNRAARKPTGPRPSKVASDLAAASRRQRLPGSSEISDDSFKLVSRSSLELDNTARDHALYHNVTPQADGLYHCPWEKEPTSNCQHKPEKLKCNYEYDPFSFFNFLTNANQDLKQQIRGLPPQAIQM
jgi:hypothetical protein